MWLVFLFAAMLMLAGPAKAQFTGNIEGVVTDPSGGTIAGGKDHAHQRRHFRFRFNHFRCVGLLSVFEPGARRLQDPRRIVGLLDRRTPTFTWNTTRHSTFRSR